MGDSTRMSPEEPLPPVVLLPEVEVLALTRRRIYLLEKLKYDTKVVEDEVEEIEKKLGLDEIQWLDHYDGTNCAEWVCIRCKSKFVSFTKGLCPVCRPMKQE